MNKQERSRNFTFTFRAVVVRIRAAAFLFAALIYPSISFSALAWDAAKLLEANLVSSVDKPIVLRDGSTTASVRTDHLRVLVEAHRRIGAVSNVNAVLAIRVDRDPDAYVRFDLGTIYFSTGMLELLGNDADMVAAVMAHEHAHFAKQHLFQRYLEIPNAVRSGLLKERSTLQQTGNRNEAAFTGALTYYYARVSFNRQQEAEADRVGTEFMAKAKYSPEGMPRFMNLMLKKGFGSRTTDYFDTHPGWEERIASSGATVATQRFDSIAENLVENKNWRRVAELVDQWLEQDVNNARAWYYRGVYLRERRNPEALQAFARSVQRDPSSLQRRREFCIELYRAGQHRESLVCAEYLPLNEERDAFVAATFQHPVIIGGHAPSLVISDEDALIIALVLGRADLVPASLRRRPEEIQRERARGARQASTARQVEFWRLECENAKKLRPGQFRDSLVKSKCATYDNAIRRQHVQVLNDR
jgi:Zn-dependent protease with chaperone function